MIGFLKNPRQAGERLRVLVPAVLLGVALAVAGCTSPSEQAAKVTTAPLSDTTTASVTFPGNSNAEAEVTPREQTPEMIAALPGPSAHLAQVAEFTLTKGDFPDSGAQVSFTRTTAPPVGTLSVIVHWNEESKEWEPVQTTQTDDSLTFSATVEHFSAYSLIDFAKDLKTLWDNNHLEWGVDPEDPEVGDRLKNGVGEWFGVTAPAPECSTEPRPEWSDMIGSENLTNILTWCASGSQDNDNLIVKVRMNRSYGGYFLTRGNPVRAEIESGLERDASDPDVGDLTRDNGYFDWKAVGAMMNNSFAMGIAPERSGDPYPVMPYGTYEFEFTKNSLLEVWPDIEADNKQLIALDTNPIFSTAGVIHSLVDFGAASHDGAGGLGFAVLALQVNDCLKAYNSPENLKGLEPSEVLALFNCGTSLSSEKTNEFALKMKWELREDKLTTQKVVDTFNDGVGKVFRFAAKAGVVVTLVTAANDFALASDSDTRIGFAPNGPEELIVFNAGPWNRHVTSDGRYEFMYPKDWKVVPGKPIEGRTGHNLSVINENGEEMSTFQTGWAQPMGQAVYMGEKDVQDIAGSFMPHLKPVLEGTRNHFSYQASNFGNGWTAFMGVHAFLERDTKREWARGFDVEKSGPTTIGGAFGRNFNDATVLAAVDPEKKGYDRYAAYHGTDEYKIIREMLLSLSDHEQ